MTVGCVYGGGWVVGRVTNVGTKLWGRVTGPGLVVLCRYLRVLLQGLFIYVFLVVAAFEFDCEASGVIDR